MLTCACGAVYREADLDRTLDVGTCWVCGAVTPLNGAMRPSLDPAQYEVEIAGHRQWRQVVGAEGLALEHRSVSVQAAFTAVIALFWHAAFFQIMFGVNLVVACVMAGFVGVVYAMGCHFVKFDAVGVVFSHTVVRVRGGELSIAYGPMSPEAPRTFAVASVSALRLERGELSARLGQLACLAVVDVAGRRHDFLTRQMALSQVRFLQVDLERELGLEHNEPEWLSGGLA